MIRRVNRAKEAPLQDTGRILLYSLNFPPELTGVGKFNGEFVDWLSSRGWKVQVICAPPYYPEWRIHKGYCGYKYSADKSNRVGVYRSPTWVPKRPNGLKRILHLLSFALSSLPVLFWVSLTRRPSVIIVTQPSLMCVPACLLICKLLGIASWMHVQDLEIDAALGLGLVRGKRVGQLTYWIEAALLRAFKKVSTISDAMRRKIANKGLQVDEIFLWRNWVDTERIFPLEHASTYRRQLGIAEGEIVALYSGNLGKKQGVDLLVLLAQQLATCNDFPKVVFVLCGQGVEYETLKVSTAGLENVKWLPLQPYERLNELLGMADVHLLPQLAGAADLVMPSKLASMLASGRPVLACADEGTELYKFATKGGVCVPPGDVNALRAGLFKLASDGALRMTLGVQGRVAAEELLSMQRILEGFELELIGVASSSRTNVATYP